MRETSHEFGLSEEIRGISSDNVTESSLDASAPEIDATSTDVTNRMGDLIDMDAPLDEAKQEKILAALRQVAPVAHEAAVLQVSPDDPKQDSKITEAVLKQLIKWKQILMATL